MPASAADITLALLNRAALLQVDHPGGGFLPVAMPEAKPPWGTDPAPDHYLSVSPFDNRPAWEGVAEGSLEQGLLQVSVVWPRGIGLIGVKAAADAVKAHFPKGLVLLQGNARVKIDREPWAASPVPEGDRTSVPVTIEWTASEV